MPPTGGMSFSPSKQHSQHEVGRNKVLVLGERRIGAGADRAFRVGLMTGGADVSEQVRSALLAELPTVAHERTFRRGVIG